MSSAAGQVAPAYTGRVGSEWLWRAVPEGQIGLPPYEAEPVVLVDVLRFAAVGSVWFAA